MKILVTDSQIRSSVALIRYFGKLGLYVIAADSDKISTGFFSKYTSKKFVYPDIIKHETQFIKQLSNFIDDEHIDIIFPMTNESVIAIAKHKDHFNNKVKIPIADISTLIKGTDKATTLKIASKLNIPIPQTYYPETISDLDQIENYPVMLKPKISSGSRGIALCNNLNELRKNFQTKSEEYNGLIIQEYIPIDEREGGEFCWYGIYDWGAQCKGYGCYKTVRSYPIGSGPSTVQESVEIKQIRHISIRLLNHLKWQGLAQLDFRIDARDKTPKLIEINGRCWAPLAHSMQAGLDVPGTWLKLACDKPIPKQPPIKLGVKTRWLLPADILWFLSSKKNLKNFKEFFKFNDINFDLIQKGDLKPILGFSLASLTYLLKKEKRQFIIRKKIKV